MKIGLVTFFVLATTLLLHPNAIVAQDTARVDLFDMSFDELINQKVTLASKKAESSFDSPLSTSVVTADEIQKSGVTTIEEALKLVPGMIVRQETNGNYDIHIRGNDNIPPGSYSYYSENTMTLVMVNNRKVYNYANGGVFWESLPIALGDVDRIEVVRGPSTALYGPNAVSGVINIVTKKSKDKRFSAAGNAQYGTNNTGIYDFAIGSSQNNDNLNLRLSGNYEKRDRSMTDYYSYFIGNHIDDIYDYWGNDLTASKYKFYPKPELAKERTGLNGTVDYRFNDKIDLSVEAGAQSSYVQSVFMETRFTPLSGRLTDSYHYNATSNLYGFSLQLSGMNGSNNLQEGEGASRYDFHIFDANVEYSRTFNKLTVRPGISYQKAEYTDLPYGDPSGGEVIGYLNAERALSSSAVFFRSEYAASDKLRLIAALRMDQYNVPDKNYLTYQFIGTYKFNDRNIVRAGYSIANRGSFIIDSYANLSRMSGAIRISGNENLKLSEMDMFEVGYRVKASNKISFDFEVFNTVTNNLTVFVAEAPTATGVETISQNIGLKSFLTGGSVNANWVISPQYQVRIWATYVDAQIKDNQIKKADLTTGMVYPTGAMEDIANPQTPNFYGGLSLIASPLKNLNVFADLYYLGEHTYMHEFDYLAQSYQQQSPDFMGSGRTNVQAKATVDLKASYQICNYAKLFVNARNLFNNNQPEFGFADNIGALYLVGASFTL